MLSYCFNSFLFSSLCFYPYFHAYLYSYIFFDLNYFFIFVFIFFAVSKSCTHWVVLHHGAVILALSISSKSCTHWVVLHHGAPPWTCRSGSIYFIISELFIYNRFKVFYKYSFTSNLSQPLFSFLIF